LLNNYNPGYLANGDIDTTTFTIPPFNTPSIGDVLLKASVSFAWFAEGWNMAVAEPKNPNNVYCNICSPFNYQSQFMADQTLRGVATQYLSDFYAGTLPAVTERNHRYAVRIHARHIHSLAAWSSRTECPPSVRAVCLAKI